MCSSKGIIISKVHVEERLCTYNVSKCLVHFSSQLVSKGSQPDMHDLDGQAPLHKAVLHGQEDSLLTLISCGADLSNTDGNGYTALHVSICYFFITTVVREIFVIKNFSYARLCTKFFIAVYKVCMLLR